MKKKVLKLGVLCTDSATGLPGMLTHWFCDEEGAIRYLFQPRGLNPENGQPVEKIYLTGNRIETEDENYEEVEIPFEIIHTTVTDEASGFSGLAVGLVRHVNGCFHVEIQPHGKLAKTGAAIKRRDFDLRQCSGKEIKNGTKEEIEKSKIKEPSPTGDSISDYFPH
jgi:hypothetical protein